MKHYSPITGARWSLRIALLIIASLALSALTAFTAGEAVAATGSDHLARNERLTVNQSIHSADSRYVLIMQGDGNLVLYKDGKALWASNTGGRPGAWAIMQGDGNLVVYAASGSALYDTRTGGTAGDTLIVQNDGNLVIYGGGRAVWDRYSGRLSTPPPAGQPGGSGPQNFDQRLAADAGVKENGTVRATGFNQPGECIMSVMRWIKAAGGRMAGGGPVSAYKNSPATLIATGSGVTAKAMKGDVIQYVSNASPDSYATGVHTVMVVANNNNGTLRIVQSNSPYGSGKVSDVPSWKPTPPSGFTAYLWRFGHA